MATAAEEMRANGNDIPVSVDGTWQRRGFQSRNGVVTCLGVNDNLKCKVLDAEILTTYCHACECQKVPLSSCFHGLEEKTY